MARRLAAALAALLAAPAGAARLLPPYAIPAGVSPGCGAALGADVDCSPAVAGLRPGVFYPAAALRQLCSDRCAASLAAFHGAVAAACASDSWPGAYDHAEPVATIADLLRHHYGLACLRDGPRLCNSAAAAYAAFLDPEAAARPGGLPAGGDYGGLNVSDPCDRCLVGILRFRAASPYYDGPALRRSSLYESKTARCGIRDMPLTMTPLTTTPLTTTPLTLLPSASAHPTCAGSEYTLRPGDDCHSVSLSQGIGTDWLLTDNNLAVLCRDFPKQGELCLVNKCKVYTVAKNDTCKSISRAHGMSEAQLRAWNPSIDAGCYNLRRMAGFQLCVDKPGVPYVCPKPTALAPAVPTTPAPVPTDVAAGTNRRCGRFYRVVAGDFCNLMTLRFGISLADFVFLNPGINDNCTNLYADQSYCVQAVGDINTYSGRPGLVSFTLGITRPGGGPSGDPATRLPDVAWKAPTPTTSPLPLASGSRGGCASYLDGAHYQKNVSKSSLKSNCDLAAQVFGVSLEDLGVWNPSLRNTSDASCAFEPGVRYCAKYYEGDEAPPPDDEPVSRLPTRDGMAANCSETVDVDKDGGPSCKEILDIYQLTVAQFRAWNPSVGSDCSGMLTGFQYCVAAKSANTTAPATKTTAARPSGPTTGTASA